MEDENSTFTEDISSPSPIEFILLLILEIPSIICTLLILAYLFTNWKTMITKALRNHVILLLVIISLISNILDLPFTINSYRLGYDQPQNSSFCLWWYWIDYTLIIISIFLTAIASLQRHILIFHSHWLHLNRRKWLLHFIPILICLCYPILFYLAVMIIYPCKHADDDTNQYCPQPCYIDNYVL